MLKNTERQTITTPVIFKGNADHILEIPGSKSVIYLLSTNSVKFEYDLKVLIKELIFPAQKKWFHPYIFATRCRLQQIM